MKRILAAILCACLAPAAALVALKAPLQQPAKPAQAAATQVSPVDLDREIREFLGREITAHVADIKALDPPQERVVNALTTGEFSWGTFMRALAAYSELSGAPAAPAQTGP